MDIKVRKVTEDEKALVRLITFKTNRGKEGTVTGIPMPGLTGPRHVAMVSAGCVYAPPYVLSDTDRIVKIERS